MMSKGLTMALCDNSIVCVRVGKFCKKSRAMDVKGRVYDSEGMGNKGGFSFVGLFFQDWQVVHPLMYSVTVCFMFGHQ